MVARPNQVSPQSTATRLALGSGGRLAQLSEKTWNVYEAPDFERMASIDLNDAYAIGTLGDGGLAAVGRRERIEVYLLSPTATEPTLRPSAIRVAGRSRRGRIMPAPGATILIADDESVTRYEPQHEFYLPKDRVSLDIVDSARPIAASGDGSAVFVRGGGAEFVYWDADAHTTTYPVPEDAGRIRHVAAGPDMDTFWLYGPKGLSLAKIADGDLALTFRRDYTGVPYHLDAAGDHAAMIVAEDEEGLGHIDWSVAVVDKRGEERWRAALPKRANRWAGGLRGLWVATSAEYVAAGGEDRLIVWDAGSGEEVFRVTEEANDVAAPAD